MNILVIDTATEACSVALQSASGTESRFEICPQQHSTKLLPMVQEVLEAANLTISDVDYLAVAVGPGSFTGVRIAMGMIQGLSYGATVPIVKISTLQAMAQECFDKDKADSVVSLIDARMSEVYFGHYQANAEGVMQLQGEEQVIPPDALTGQTFSDLHAYTAAGTGWKAYEPLAEIAAQSSDVLYPKALHMLPMAKQQIAEGNIFKASEIEPTYLRDKVTWKKLPGR